MDSGLVGLLILTRQIGQLVLQVLLVEILTVSRLSLLVFPDIRLNIVLELIELLVIYLGFVDTAPALWDMRESMDRLLTEFK